MRPFKKPIEQPELIENLHRRGVDGVAAKIAQEIAVLFQHHGRHAGAREQQPGHHARRAAPDDYAIRIAHALTNAAISV